MIKLFRTSTVPVSLDVLLKGQLKFLNQHFNVTAISGNGIGLDNVKNREGVKTHPITMQRHISPIKDFVSLIKLFLYFKKEKPLIVHSITPKAGLLTMLAGKLAGVPIRIHTFTGLIFPTKTGIMQKILIQMDRLLCWAATQIFPEGQGVKNDLVNHKITSKPLKIIANGNVNGIDLDFFNPNKISPEQQIKLKQELNIQPDDFVFIFIGRLVGDKGINELIQAFIELNNPNTKLLLVGPQERELDPLQPHTIKNIENHKNIISVGFQKDVRPYLAISHCLAFPSYREGFPNVVMQAGAMGLPSIVSNINGSNEIIIEGQNGTIIPVKNVEELKNKMNLFINDATYFEKLKLNCRRMIAERYEQSVVWQALLEEYNKQIASYNQK
ncbi:glycosyltransferase family 4 protein [Capnocytophaga sp.]|uniref:glycosyltransferase family 4 protein n=1 Tax=Capnocytophaga sp. TaxID=44737 RepID=UPI0026DCFD82|nr:glycosyltransferase family 4 protein [Capnocytophaga sp.]MDO5104875.1 glycosyltransferase family 4 protein [Capnocytophaga sp.]